MTVVSRQSVASSSSAALPWLRAAWRLAAACTADAFQPENQRSSSTSAHTPITKSKGVYVSRLDLAQGTLSAPVLAAESSNPSFLAVHPTRDLALRGQRDWQLRGQARAGRSARFHDQSRDRGADAPQQTTVGGWRPRAPRRRSRRQKRARRQLRRRERRRATDRRRRRAQARDRLRPAHRLERQPRSAERTTRAFGQRRCRATVSPMSPTSASTR